MLKSSKQNDCQDSLKSLFINVLMKNVQLVLTIILVKVEEFVLLVQKTLKSSMKDALLSVEMD